MRRSKNLKKYQVFKITPWPRKKLGEICEIIAGQAPPSEFYNTKGLGKPFLKVSSFGEIYPKIDTWTTKSLRESREGDVLFSVAGSLGMVNLGINACITRSIFALRPNTKLVLQKFLFYSLKFFGKVIANSGAGTAQKIITISQLSNFQIPLPPLPIQKKIVSILDTIQSAIDIQNKIIEKTKELKKSIMADLFKYGGPSFRKGRKLKKTEIGEIPENWEVVRLGEVGLKVKAGGTPNTSKEEYWNGEISFALIEDLVNAGKFLTKTKTSITKNGLKNSSSWVLPENSIILSLYATVGKPVINKIPVAITQNMLGIIPNRQIVDCEFLFYALENSQNNLWKYTDISVHKHITVSKAKNILIPLPPLSEQREIAEILQTIDQKIEIEQKKKELYEELFKTMLNKIFNQEIDIEKIKI
ncbi:MAG: restriction endonuclease subunit S [Candidatus Aenigmatarchaeota archaeon]